VLLNKEADRTPFRVHPSIRCTVFTLPWKTIIVKKTQSKKH